MIGWIARFFDRLLRARVIHYITAVPLDWKSESGSIITDYMHLYEDENGKRWCEYIPSALFNSGIKRDPMSHGKRHRTYNLLVLPWLHHKYTNEQVIAATSRPAPAPAAQTAPNIIQFSKKDPLQ